MIEVSRETVRVTLALLFGLRGHRVQEVVRPADGLFQAAAVGQMLAQALPLVGELVICLVGRAIAMDLPADQRFELFGRPPTSIGRRSWNWRRTGCGHW